MPLRGLGLVAYLRGEHAAAEARFQEALSLMWEMGDTWSAAMVRHDLAAVALERGRPGEAAALYGESLAHWRELGNPRGVALCVAGLAGVALHHGRPEQAARLLGAAEAMRELARGIAEPTDLPAMDRYAGALRVALGDVRVTAHLAVGRALPAEEAIAEALSLAVTPVSSCPAASTAGAAAARSGRTAAQAHRLTARELEVARLLAQGLSNRQLAERLFITEGTASLHVKRILGKLDFASRAQITAWALLHGLGEPAQS
jgi:non-specific serine/threonine protein kinase